MGFFLRGSDFRGKSRKIAKKADDSNRC